MPGVHDGSAYKVELGLKMVRRLLVMRVHLDAIWENGEELKKG